MIESLGYIYRDHPVTIIDKLFFDQFPYKLVVKPSAYTGHFRAQQLINALKALLPAANDKSLIRIAIHDKQVFLYIRNFSDFEYIEALYHDKIMQVCGPISNYHIELLTDPLCKVKLLDHLWYYQYNLRVDVSGYATHSEAQIDQLADTLSKNLTNYKLLGKPKYSAFTFYTDYDEFVQFMGIFELLLSPTIQKQMLRGFVIPDIVQMINT